MHRREEAGSAAEDSPPPLPDDVERAELQGPEDGAGPLFHRRYEVRVRDARVSPAELMSRIRGDLNAASPTEFARFFKVRGGDGDGDGMRVGDEYVVRMPGPWDGPVRVVEVTPDGFRLATLDGHLEAGQIAFTASGDGELVFAIESWARSADRVSDLLYQRLRMAKEVQLHMWTSFLERVARLAGGRMTGGVTITTRRVDELGAAETLRSARTRRAIDALHAKPVNFDFDRLAVTACDGWRIDDYRRSLPPEPPGPPVGGGTWETTRRLMRDYEFADPSIVRAIYYADRPLEQRDMLLELRFHGLRFRAGVRVGGVRDETRDVDGRPVRVWGWNYQTLQGHLEMGQMDFEVWKWLGSGDVEFRIHAFSRPGSIRNPLVRLGFRLVGRREQIRFARHACDRIERLAKAELAGRAPASVPRAADAIAAGPVGDVA